ncbi:MAG: hypothetical protein U5J98_05210 [Halobacteriales archaeon]|nr:hypothetical protein [Halobacteriales archaeon]
MRKTVIGADVGDDLDLFEGVDGVDGLPHSEAVAVDLPGYRRVFVSGTAAIDEAGDIVAPGDAAAQAEHIYETLSGSSRRPAAGWRTSSASGSSPSP